jgi:hypothetical protein
MAPGNAVITVYSNAEIRPMTFPITLTLSVEIRAVRVYIAAS